MLYTNGTEFRLKRFALWLLGKEINLPAMFTRKTLANGSPALSNRF